MASDLTHQQARNLHPDAQREVQTVTVERHRNGWIIVRLDGHIVFRRLTRDPMFTRVALSWPSSGTPNQPRTLASFWKGQLGGAWRPAVVPSGTAWFDLPPVGERWHYRRQPDQERTAHTPFPRPGGWVRDGAVRQVF